MLHSNSPAAAAVDSVIMSVTASGDSDETDLEEAADDDVVDDESGEGGW